MSRRGQIVFNLDADRSETMDLDPDPARVGPGAGVDSRIAAGGMADALLSANSGHRQDSGQGPGNGTGDHKVSQLGNDDEHRPHTKKKRLSKARAARRATLRGTFKK